MFFYMKTYLILTRYRPRCKQGMRGRCIGSILCEHCKPECVRTRSKQQGTGLGSIGSIGSIGSVGSISNIGYIKGAGKSPKRVTGKQLGW